MMLLGSLDGCFVQDPWWGGPPKSLRDLSLVGYGDSTRGSRTSPRSYVLTRGYLET